MKNLAFPTSGTRQSPTSLLALLLPLLILSSCHTKKAIVLPDNQSPKQIDVQGHRGCRGLMPENTIPAFIAALDLEVTTLELDVVISADKTVIISHEPFFHHDITSVAGGQPITKDTEKQHNIYTLSDADIENYDVGLKPHPKFTKQKKIATTKPSLTELITSVTKKCNQLAQPLPYFNIEIKRKKDQDDIFHPAVIEYVNLVVEAIKNNNIQNRSYIQSFDVETLEEVRKLDGSIPLVLLIGNKKSTKKNLSQLSFSPEVYSPYYKLVNPKLIRLCRSKGIKVIPWTVNDKKDMTNLLELGVDGIITDYPDVLMNLIESRKEYQVLH